MDKRSRKPKAQHLQSITGGWNYLKVLFGLIRSDVQAIQTEHLDFPLNPPDGVRKRMEK